MGNAGAPVVLVDVLVPCRRDDDPPLPRPDDGDDDPPPFLLLALRPNNLTILQPVPAPSRPRPRKGVHIDVSTL